MLPPVWEREMKCSESYVMQNAATYKDGSVRLFEGTILQLNFYTSIVSCGAS